MQIDGEAQPFGFLGDDQLPRKLLQAFEVEAQNRLLFPERRLYAPPFGDLIREHRVGARQFGGSLSEVAQGDQRARSSSSKRPAHRNAMCVVAATAGHRPVFSARVVQVASSRALNTRLRVAVASAMASKSKRAAPSGSFQSRCVSRFTFNVNSANGVRKPSTALSRGRGAVVQAPACAGRAAPGPLAFYSGQYGCSRAQTSSNRNGLVT